MASSQRSPGGINDVIRYAIASVDIMRGIPQGLAGLDLSASGFWRSFMALIWILPFSLFLDFLGYGLVTPQNTGDEVVSLPYYMFARELSSLLAYLVALVVIYGIARSINVQANYPICVISYNWGSLALNVIAFPFVVTTSLMARGEAASGSPLLLLIVFGLTVVFAVATYNIIRITLQISSLPAILFVFVITVVEMVVFYSMLGLFGI